MKDQEYDFFYEDKGDTEYCYPGTNILKNKLNIQNLERLKPKGIIHQFGK